MTIKIAVIQFPGSNTERETFMALRRVGMQGEEFLWNQNPKYLENYDGYIIVGGFSYEDRSRAGIIAALDPIMLALRQQTEHGKPLLGICNGAQILVESGLVPGVADGKTVVALTDNRRVQNDTVLGTGYYNVWVNLKRGINSQVNVFTQQFNDKTVIHVPIAHAEGRFMLAPKLLNILQQQGQIALQYCNDDGKVEDDFPTNPNGSMAAIAALSNVNGNIMAMMPHPERTPNGDAIFASMRAYIEKGNYPRAKYLDWSQPDYIVQPYSPDEGSFAFTVSLMITDNHAASVQMILQAQGINATIQRQIYWEVTPENHVSIDEIKAAIIDSGELWNLNKERLTTNPPCSHSFLVLPHDDMIGQQKNQILSHHFLIKGIINIKHGILWHINCKSTDQDTIKKLLDIQILFNPECHDCYYY